MDCHTGYRSGGTLGWRRIYTGSPAGQTTFGMLAKGASSFEAALSDLLPDFQHAASGLLVSGLITFCWIKESGWILRKVAFPVIRSIRSS